MLHTASASWSWPEIALFVAAIITSGFLVALFSSLATRRGSPPGWMALDSKWLAVAFIPLVAFFLFSGHVEGIETFGVKLKFALKESASSALPSSTVGKALPSSSVEGLKGVFEARVVNGKVETIGHYLVDGDSPRETQCVIFSIGNDYSANGVLSLLRELERLECVAVYKEDGTFVSLIPIGEFRSADRQPNTDTVNEFLDALKTNNVGKLRLQQNTHTISPTTSILRAYELMRTWSLDLLPIVSPNVKLLNIARRADIEQQIAEKVLDASLKPE